jgi:rubrerythrin
MIEYLNEDEVYRVGMCIEQAGLDFYTRMADTSDDQGTRRVFKRLARDEKAHLAFFESLELKTSRGMGSSPADLDSDTSLYVCSLVDGGIFANIEKMSKTRRFSPEAALELALQVEKDAVLYYSEALAVTKKRSTRDALKRLVDEEKGHVVEITKRLTNLRKKKAREAKKK